MLNIQYTYISNVVVHCLLQNKITPRIRFTIPKLYSYSINLGLFQGFIFQSEREHKWNLRFEHSELNLSWQKGFSNYSQTVFHRFPIKGRKARTEIRWDCSHFQTFRSILGYFPAETYLTPPRILKSLSWITLTVQPEAELSLRLDWFSTLTFFTCQSNFPF